MNAMGPELSNELHKIRNEIAHGLSNPIALVKRLTSLGIQIEPEDIPELVPAILRYSGMYHVPSPLVKVIAALVEDGKAGTICDPWAGLGTVLATAQDATRASRAVAITEDAEQAALGRRLVPHAEWLIGDPLQLLREVSGAFDIVASVLPFGAKRRHDSPAFQTPNGERVALPADLGQAILAVSASRLSTDGIGIFITPPSLFTSKDSVRPALSRLGLTIDAALLLPSGAFAPMTNISTYVVVIRRHPSRRMFVAQLTGDDNTNAEIVGNFKNAREGGSLGLGRLVDPLTFSGLEAIRFAEKFKQLELMLGVPAIAMEGLATTINLGRPAEAFEFPSSPNSIFVPLIGSSDVVDSPDDLRLRRHNYAQVVIDPAKSDARFVAKFLNSELGKEFREAAMTGAFIPKLNKQTLKSLRVFVPSLPTQKKVLDVETRIAAQQNTVLGLQNELAELRRELWANPTSVGHVREGIEAVAGRLSGGIKEHASERLDQWFETLPFPLASILRAWQTTSSQDYKTKHEHLLHLFEATAEFISVVLLSAFSSNEALFEPHKEKLKETLAKQNLSFRRATFGTWKVVVEYLGKQTRRLLTEARAGDESKNNRALCAAIFADPSLVLPTALSQTELAGIFSRTNKMRNDWTGHGGVVGQEEAQLRNEQLLAEVQKLRETFADAWADVQLVRALQCRPRRGLFENEIAVLMGSNSDFLKETKAMSVWLDVDELYLAAKNAGAALQLLPLVKIGASPQSAKNACYFFSKVDDGSAKFVSYHFTDTPEIKQQLQDVSAPVRGLVDM